MRTYRLTRDASQAYTLHVIDGTKSRLPIVIASDQRPSWPMMNVAMTLLLDYFDGEEDAEIKTVLMSRALVQFLNKLGEEWTLTQAELNDAVMDILVSLKMTVDETAHGVCVEYVAGCRRDTLRLL